MNKFMKFAEMITMYRKAKGISLRQLAKELDIPFGTIYQIECGHSPTARNLVKLLLWALNE